VLVTSLDILIAGLIQGGIYALIAVGLNLQYGVARVLNVSHGEFIMLAAFITYSLYSLFGINPLLSLLICGPFMLIIGFLIHRTLFQRLRDTSESIDIFEGNSLLASFGLLFIIQNIALLIWTANIRGYSYLTSPVNLSGAIFPENRLVALLFAVVISFGFYFFLMRTRLGKAIRAAAQEPTTAGLSGVNIKQVLAICFGLGALMAGFAGALISMTREITPMIGLNYTIIAMIVVVLGGLGSITGSLIGGFILGIVGSIVTYIDAALALIAYYVIFIVLLLVKPTGILGK
jgi:branched-chain amino acid transport system permease protein